MKEKTPIELVSEIAAELLDIKLRLNELNSKVNALREKLSEVWNEDT